MSLAQLSIIKISKIVMQAFISWIIFCGNSSVTIVYLFRLEGKKTMKGFD